MRYKFSLCICYSIFILCLLILPLQETISQSNSSKISEEIKNIQQQLEQLKKNIANLKEKHKKISKVSYNDYANKIVKEKLKRNIQTNKITYSKPSIKFPTTNPSENKISKIPSIKITQSLKIISGRFKNSNSLTLSPTKLLPQNIQSPPKKIYTTTKPTLNGLPSVKEDNYNKQSISHNRALITSLITNLTSLYKESAKALIENCDGNELAMKLEGVGLQCDKIQDDINCTTLCLLIIKVKSHLDRLKEQRAYKELDITHDEIKSLKDGINKLISFVKNKKTTKVTAQERVNQLCQLLINLASPSNTTYITLPDRERKLLYQVTANNLQELAKKQKIAYCNPQGILIKELLSCYPFRTAKGVYASKALQLKPSNITDALRTIFYRILDVDNFMANQYDVSSYASMPSRLKDKYNFIYNSDDLIEALEFNQCAEVRENKLIQSIFDEYQVKFEANAEGKIIFKNVDNLTMIFDRTEYKELETKFESARLKFISEIAEIFSGLKQWKYEDDHRTYSYNCIAYIGSECKDFEKAYYINRINHLLTYISREYNNIPSSEISALSDKLSKLTEEDIFKAYQEFKDFFQGTISRKKQLYLQLLEKLEGAPANGESSTLYNCIKYLSAHFYSHLHFLLSPIEWSFFLSENKIAKKYEESVKNTPLYSPFSQLVEDFRKFISPFRSQIGYIVRQEHLDPELNIPPGSIGLYLELREKGEVGNPKVIDSLSDNDKRDALNKLREIKASFYSLGIAAKLLQFYANALSCFEKGDSFSNTLTKVYKMPGWDLGGDIYDYISIFKLILHENATEKNQISQEIKSTFTYQAYQEILNRVIAENLSIYPILIDTLKTLKERHDDKGVFDILFDSNPPIEPACFASPPPGYCSLKKFINNDLKTLKFMTNEITRRTEKFEDIDFGEIMKGKQTLDLDQLYTNQVLKEKFCRKYGFKK